MCFSSKRRPSKYYSQNMSRADCLHKHISSHELSYCSCNYVVEDFEWPAGILTNDWKFSYSRDWYGSSSETQGSEIASLYKIEDVFWLGGILLVIQASKKGPTQSSTNQKIPKRSAWNSLSSTSIKCPSISSKKFSTNTQTHLSFIICAEK